MTPARLRVLDLFSGIGGFSLGLENLGRFETIAFCEIDPFCQKILKKHWPLVPILNDVRTANFKEIHAEIITGGFPCQDISNSGRREGITGSRSGLWSEIRRAICDVRPQFAILENVAALSYRGLDTVLSDLAKIGYCAQWHCISASAFGAVHHRDRIWIIAYPHQIGGIVSEKIFTSIANQIAPEGVSNELLAVLACWREIQSIDALLDVRKHDGISSAVDRIGALGNSIYPAITTVIGKSILATY